MGFVLLLAACGARTELGVRHNEDGGVVVNPPDSSPPDDCGASLASGPSWNTSFGPAQHVCLSPSSPANCPNDALVYANGFGWSADISTLGGTWIWRPGISTSDPSDLVQVSFTRMFTLHGSPTGSITIAADDYAQVVVNGAVVGSIGSIVDPTVAQAAQAALTTFDLSKNLVEGVNTITVIGQNGPASFGGCGGACTYAQNPAGVVFGGSLDCR